MSKKIDFEIKRKVLREYHKDQAVLSFRKGIFWFEDKVSSILIGMMKKRDFPYIEKDERTLSITTPRGFIELRVTHRDLVNLKKQLYLYEAVHLEKKPGVLGKKITAKDVAWNFV